MVIHPKGIMKDVSNFSRTKTKNCLHSLFRTLLKDIPQTQEVISILSAKVPIIKFKFVPTAMPCDLSAEGGMDSDGLKMAHLQYSLSQCDERVFGVAVLIKHWAKKNGVAQEPISGIIGFSSFQLLMLVIHFLQHKSIVPPLKHLLDGSSDRENDSKESPHEHNDEGIEELVRGFFRYYLRFPFKYYFMDVFEGTIVNIKSCEGTMSAFNPLDRARNVFQNITPRKLEKFCRAIEIAVNNEDRDLIQVIKGSMIKAELNQTTLQNKKRLKRREIVFEEKVNFNVDNIFTE